MVTLAFVVFLCAHGLVHLLGFMKAFGYAALPGLTVPISPIMGCVWLAAGGACVAAAVAVVAWPRGWWILGVLALVLSMSAVVSSWADARAGAAANAVVLVGVAFGVLAYGPTSLRAAYERDVAATQPVATEAPALIAESDLAPLPPVVQRYLRGAGVVGQPRVRDVAVRMHGRIRGAPDAPWMSFTSEQCNTFGDRPTRLFYMTATRAMLPIQGYHRFVGSPASMRVKAAALVPVLDESGDAMTQSETVTLFNDLVLMAPAALVDAPVTWQPEVTSGDRVTVRGRFAHLDRAVDAVVVFALDGRLIDFVSDDRYQASADGTTMTRQRWSTPMAEVRSFGQIRLAASGQARWHDERGSWAYLQLTIDDIRYNPGR